MAALCFFCTMVDGTTRPAGHDGPHGAVAPNHDVCRECSEVRADDGTCGCSDVEPCDYAGHDPETEDIADGVVGGGASHVYVTRCRRCDRELIESEPDEDGRVEWEVLL